MLDLATMAFDNEAAERGAWEDFFNGAKLLIGSTHSLAYRRVLTEKARKHRLNLDEENPDAVKLIQDLTCEALAEKVLLGWQGVVSGGKEVPYTPEAGYRALSTIPKMREFVEERAQADGRFNQQVLEKAKKP